MSTNVFLLIQTMFRAISSEKIETIYSRENTQFFFVPKSQGKKRLLGCSILGGYAATEGCSTMQFPKEVICYAKF